MADATGAAAGQGGAPEVPSPFAHRAWPAGVSPDGGWSAPELPAPREIPLAAEAAPLLAERGIRLRGTPGPGCRLVLDAATPVQRLVLDLTRVRGFTLLLGQAARLSGEITGFGAGHLLAATGAGGEVPFHLRCTFRGEGSLILLGRGATSNHTGFLAEGPGNAILVGDDCMFAKDTQIRTFDSHAIIDIATRSPVNSAQSVLIGPHVWLGQEALVMPGTRVGAGAILAARATATRDVAPRTLVAGTPARVIREGVTWTRQARPSPAQIAEVLDALPEA